MNYRKLGTTDLEVSVICLGTMTWGEQNSQKEAFDQMNYSIERGINFFDTAELYPIMPLKATYGKTEEIIGNWLKEKKKREKIILSLFFLSLNQLPIISSVLPYVSFLGITAYNSAVSKKFTPLSTA